VFKILSFFGPSAQPTVRGQERAVGHPSSRAFRAGDLVEVRSKEEILRTLDSQAGLDGLPFMPEMFAFCGKQFRVMKRAHKTCDTVFPIRSRRLADAVILETRCSGTAHGGCDATCTIFWKTAWLRMIDAETDRREPQVSHAGGSVGCTEAAVWAASVNQQASTAEETIYSCQATQLPYATSELNWWEPSQYVEDYASGNVRLREMIRAAIYASYYNLSQAGIGLGRPMRWLYDRLRPLWRGSRFPRTAGQIPAGSPTPQRQLHLRPGEIVRVRPHEEILTTLNTETKNRGMYWDAEMVPFCGKEFRVLKRVDQILEERTGRMLKMKGEAVILEDAACEGRYSCKRYFCPRALYPFWREIWLERVE
jgi:hypothetical protein